MNRSFDSEYTVFFDMDDEDTLELELNPEQMRELAAAVAAHEALTQRAESEQEILPAAPPAAFEEHHAQPLAAKVIQAPPIQAQPVRVQPTEVQPTEVQSTEVQPTEVQSTEVQPTEVQPTEVQPTEVQLTEVQLTEVQLTEVQLTEVQPIEVSLAPVPVTPPPPAPSQPAERCAPPAPSLQVPAIATGEPTFGTGDNSPRRRMRVVAVAGVSGAVLVMGITAYLATMQRDEPSNGATPSPSLSLTAAPAPTEIPAPRPAPAPALLEAQPVLFTNPFDSQEVFEFPPGTSRIEARDAVAELLLQRARERYISMPQKSMPQKIRANKKAADRASHVSKARELAQRN